MSLSNNFPTIKPSLNLDFANTKRLDPRVTFTRSTTGTYYDGVTTAKAEENLLFYSQQFNFAPWATGNFTVTADATTAPDGTTTAESFVPDTTSTANHQLSQSFTVAANAPYVFSIFVKPFGYTKIAFRESVQTGAYATFDLSGSGSVVSTGNVAFVFITNAAITSVAGGWFRINLTVTSSNAVSLGMAVFALNNTYTSGDPYSASVATGNGTDGVYIWGAQLEQRSSVTAYTATTTQPITNYIPVLLTAAANVPRFDHNPTTDESLGLLIEEQRTNTYTYSQDLSVGGWTKYQTGVVANTAVAPDGTLTADKITDNSANDAHAIYQISSVTNGVTYTASFYAKAGERTQISVQRNDGFIPSLAPTFDLIAGTVSGSGASSSTITPVGNGWYRCTVTVTATGTSAGSGVGVYLMAGGATNYAGNGFSGMYFWGFQFEVGSFPTSYIPTTSAAATRAEDGASMTGINLSSWFNNAQGTLYIDGTRFGTNLYPRFAGFYSGNTENYSMGIGQWSASTVSFYGVNGTTQFDISRAPSGLAYGSQVRAAGAYAVNNVGLSANGTATSVDTDATIPYIDIFWIGGGVNPRLNGWLKKVAYYPVRVTDAQLQALTT